MEDYQGEMSVLQTGINIAEALTLHIPIGNNQQIVLGPLWTILIGWGLYRLLK